MATGYLRKIFIAACVLLNFQFHFVSVNGECSAVEIKSITKECKEIVNKTVHNLLSVLEERVAQAIQEISTTSALDITRDIENFINSDDSFYCTNKLPPQLRSPKSRIQQSLAKCESHFNKNMAGLENQNSSILEKWQTVETQLDTKLDTCFILNNLSDCSGLKICSQSVVSKVLHKFESKINKTIDTIIKKTLSEHSDCVSKVEKKALKLKKVIFKRIIRCSLEELGTVESDVSSETSGLSSSDTSHRSHSSSRSRQDELSENNSDSFVNRKHKKHRSSHYKSTSSSAENSNESRKSHYESNHSSRNKESRGSHKCRKSSYSSREFSKSKDSSESSERERCNCNNLDESKQSSNSDESQDSKQSQTSSEESNGSSDSIESSSSYRPHHRSDNDYKHSRSEESELSADSNTQSQESESKESQESNESSNYKYANKSDRENHRDHTKKSSCENEESASSDDSLISDEESDEFTDKPDANTTQDKTLQSSNGDVVSIHAKESTHIQSVLVIPRTLSVLVAQTTDTQEENENATSRRESNTNVQSTFETQTTDKELHFDNAVFPIAPQRATETQTLNDTEESKTESIVTSTLNTSEVSN